MRSVFTILLSAGLILSSFFYGYLLTNVPGGWLASKYGGKWVLGFGVLWGSILTLLTPIAATYSPYLLVVLRLLIGLGQVRKFLYMDLKVLQNSVQ